MAHPRRKVGTSSNLPYSDWTITAGTRRGEWRSISPSCRNCCAGTETCGSNTPSIDYQSELRYEPIPVSSCLLEDIDSKTGSGSVRNDDLPISERLPSTNPSFGLWRRPNVDPGTDAGIRVLVHGSTVLWRKRHKRSNRELPTLRTRKSPGGTGARWRNPSRAVMKARLG